MKEFLIFFKRHWISIPLCLLILFSCFMNTEPLPKIEITNFDKLVHFVMFLTVSGVIYFENTNYFKRKISWSKVVNFSFFFPVVYSGLIEIGQEYLTSTRSGDVWDFLFNVIGALAGLIICLLINKRLA